MFLHRFLTLLALLCLPATPLLAYHVGEKPQPTPVSHTGAPRILHLSQTMLEFVSPASGTVTLRISDVRGNLLSNNGRLYDEAEPSNGAGRFLLRLDRLGSGVYFIVLSNSAGVSATGVVEVR